MLARVEDERKAGNLTEDQYTGMYEAVVVGTMLNIFALQVNTTQLPLPSRCQNVASDHFYVLEGPGYGLHVYMILRPQ